MDSVCALIQTLRATGFYFSLSPSFTIFKKIHSVQQIKLGLHVILVLVQDDLLFLVELGFFTELITLRFGAEEISLYFQSLASFVSLHTIIREQD